MALIKSISGIRGTIGAGVRDGLNPISAAQFTSAYAQFIREYTGKARPRIVVGRDGRMSGTMLKQVVVGTLLGMGCDVIDLDYSTTPTTEMAVMGKRADGGIILTASHNPREWNALKLLNDKGEFISAAQGQEILRLAESKELNFAPVESLGRILEESSYLEEHIAEILKARGVDVEAIKAANLKIAYDSINSVGAIALPPLFAALGIQASSVYGLNTDVTGNFSHNPEPLPEHLDNISSLIKEVGADVGFVVDPDVDRLAIFDEKGNYFGEEYTLVAIADCLLELNGGGNTVSNLSSTRALRDITLKHGGKHVASAVGEVNVVAKMKATDALIGGEGNGGVIYPELHYGRDSLVGIALFLSLLAKSKKTVSELRSQYPEYFMVKLRVELDACTDTQLLLERLAQTNHEDGEITLIDGVKVDFPDKWVHVRRSNTEPIIRIYTEAKTQHEAEELAAQYKRIILSYLKD